MIDFELGDELELVRATAREFAEDHLRPALREHETARAVSESARAAFAEIGFAGLECPEAVGGSDLGSLARCVVSEELAAGDAGAALALDPLGAALYPLLEIGGEEAVVRFGRSVLDTPGARAVLVWNGDEARCRIATGGDRVSGALPWVPADRVDLLVLLDEQGATLVRDGIRCEPVRGAGLRAAGASALSLDAAPVVATLRGAEAATRALARARLHTAALLIGIMRESAEFSRSYALERVAFGKPIAHHQALAFLIADMATAVDASRLLLWEAAWRLDEAAEGGPCSTELAAEACATAFAEAVEQSQFVTPNGVQILGGHGFMQDYPVEKMMREARALGLLLGGVDRAREEAGRELCAWEGPIALTVEAAS